MSKEFEKFEENINKHLIEFKEDRKKPLSQVQKTHKYTGEWKDRIQDLKSCIYLFIFEILHTNPSYPTPISRPDLSHPTPTHSEEVRPSSGSQQVCYTKLR